jgi:hypothetical protein
MAADQNIILGIKGQDQGAIALFQAVQKELADSTAEQKRLNTQVKQYDKIAQQANKVTRNSNGNYKEANRSMRTARGAAGQLGYQIQDIAVQLQGGQNLGLIIGQQGSQIASVFGTGGIVAGAIISIGALFATMMVPKLFEAGQEAKNLEKIFKDLNDTLLTVSDEGVSVLADDFVKLAKANKDFAEVALAAGLTKAVEGSTVAFEGLSRAAGEFNFVIDNVSNQNDTAAVQARAAQLQFANYAKQLGISTEQAVALKAASEAVISGVDGSSESISEMLAELVMLPGATDKFKTLANEVVQFAYSQIEAQDNVDRLTELLNNLDVALDENTSSYVDQQKAVEKTLETMRLEVGAYGMSARVIALRDAAIEGANATQLREIDILQERLEVMKQQEDAEKLMTDILGKTGTARDQYLNKYREQLDELNQYRDDDIISDEEYTRTINNLAKQRSDNLAKYAEQDRKTRMESINFIGQSASILESAFEEGSKAQKAAFLVNQGVAMANAIVSTEQAAAQALATFGAGGVAMSGVIRAMGYASVAAIAGQTLGSFEGGGFTGMGSRTGGVDGKGGFAAILHPNETVIDHTKGQGSGMNVTVNINAVDTKGFDELLYKRRGQLVSIINQAVNNRGRASIV